MPHKVFVSYHHRKDQAYATDLRDFYGSTNTQIDRSLPDEIDSDDSDYILSQIRTKHLKDSTVTIVLIGPETWSRRWVDWEIYSSLRPYGGRSVNGLLGIVLPGATRLPERFQDNYRQESLFGSIKQTGYAKLVHWVHVAPPENWRYSYAYNPALEERRQYLSRWIEYAFENRSRTDLINNSRARMRRSRSI